MFILNDMDDAEKYAKEWKIETRPHIKAMHKAVLILFIIVH
jgi:hypothetical protein